MTSQVLRVAARMLSPMLVLLAVVLMLRGHNAPGGGFIGGLVLAMALLLPAFVEQATPRLSLWVDPRRIIGAGWLIALLAAMWGWLFGDGFFTAMWSGSFYVPILGKLKFGTPMLFDLGVFLTVGGVTLKIASLFMQAASEPPDGEGTMKEKDGGEPTQE